MEQRGDPKKDELNNRSINVYLHKGLEVIIPEQTHGEDNVLRICNAQVEKQPRCVNTYNRNATITVGFLVTNTLHQIHHIIHSGKCIKTKRVEYIRAYIHNNLI
jgi:hypothetical protein